MLDFEKIRNDYCEFIHNKNYLKKIKREPYVFYMSHLDEIEPYLEEYFEYENAKDKKSSNALLNAHPDLKSYLSLEFEKELFEQRMKKYSISPELNTLGNCVTYVAFKNNDLGKDSNKYFVIYDLDNDTENVYENPDDKIIEYIKKGLIKLNKYITEIYFNELNLIKVIYSDIKSDPNYHNLTQKEIFNKIVRELLRARIFDNGILLNDEESNLPSSVEEYKTIIHLYNEGKIDKDEYYIRFYKYRILAECDVVKMYMESDPEQKKYIIDAYISLSSSKRDSNLVHIRTASEEINKQVLERRRKKTDTI